jgi:hypothetical protein
VNDGWADSAWPNWSWATAANCRVPPSGTVAAGGATAMLVSVWLTVTFAILVAVSPAESVIVTWKM